MSGCSSEPLNVAPASTKNQLTGPLYDAAGNVTNDGLGHTPTYDTENRIATVAGVTYSYDADGVRIEKSPGTMYWPGLGGEYLAETDLTGTINEEYIYFNGVRIARVDRPSGAVHYYFSDQLGSASVITSSTGGVQEQYFYYPFGGLLSSIGSDSNHYKFTGKERDTESGLDYFEARHYASTMGRFMQPDPLFAIPLHVVSPQRWNMYAYVVNNPTNYVDPDGKDAIAVNFVNEVPLGGHAGIIVVHADGSATYARFGPEHAASPADAGKVTVQGLKPVQFGSNGLPTDASYKELSEEVAKIEGQPASTVGFNYFKTSEADSIALDNWMQEWKSHQAPDYNVTSQNCATFCIAGLIQGHAIENKNISIIPNRLFMLLAPVATENWTWQGRSNPEPDVQRHKKMHCLINRDGTCVQ
jgi:RHS repeat-associated protein